VPRLLGQVDGLESGPSLVCIGGLHGNEPAGVHGLLQVLEGLAGREGRMRGRFTALSGNRAALREGRRYLARDLNRAWTPDRVQMLREEGVPSADPEDEEQRGLLAAIEDAARDAHGPVYVLDLHTTSGFGGPFSTVADTLPNRRFALEFPAPLILGLEEIVDGTLLEYLGDCGFVAAVFESGQHEEPDAVERAVAAIWIAVAAAGLLPESELPELPRARKRLATDTRALPRVLEMRHRHPVEAADGFRMAPGYENFQRVREGETVARDHEGIIRVPESARILMPLYQDQGQDGFFVVREFGAFWLHVSRAMRRLGLASVVHWLPGIRRSPDDPGALVVDRRVARWYALQLLHLLGFRKEVEVGRTLVVHRRRFDVRRPGSPEVGPGAGEPSRDEGRPGDETRGTA